MNPKNQNENTTAIIYIIQLAWPYAHVETHLVAREIEQVYYCVLVSDDELEGSTLVVQGTSTHISGWNMNPRVIEQNTRDVITPPLITVKSATRES